MARKSKKNPAPELIGRLREDLDELLAATKSSPPNSRLRKTIDAEVRVIIEQLDLLIRDLDPVSHPTSVFDPSDPSLVGRFVALALIAQPKCALADVQPFYGSGVYALYYEGEFPSYIELSNTETAIYVGKADPASDIARTPGEQGQRLYRRLNDHKGNIGKAASTLKVEDFSCRFLVVQSGWQGAAEDYLINFFAPIWNSETGVCYGLGKHGDSPFTRGNKRSPWDTLHPGRKWAWDDPSMEDAKSRQAVEAEIATHLAGNNLYQSINDILQSFILELRQL